jgi:hypothetical protein
MKVFLMTKPCPAKAGDKTSSGTSAPKVPAPADEHSASESEGLTQSSDDDAQLQVSSESATLELQGEACVSLSALLAQALGLEKAAKPHQSPVVGTVDRSLMSSIGRGAGSEAVARSNRLEAQVLSKGIPLGQAGPRPLATIGGDTLCTIACPLPAISTLQMSRKRSSWSSSQTLECPSTVSLSSSWRSDLKSRFTFDKVMLPGAGLQDCFKSMCKPARKSCQAA